MDPIFIKRNHYFKSKSTKMIMHGIGAHVKSNIDYKMKASRFNAFTYRCIWLYLGEKCNRRRHLYYFIQLKISKKNREKTKDIVIMVRDVNTFYHFSKNLPQIHVLHAKLHVIIAPFTTLVATDIETTL